MAEGVILSESPSEIPVGRVKLHGLRVQDDCTVAFSVRTELGEGSVAAELSLVCFLDNIVHATKSAQPEILFDRDRLALSMLDDEPIKFRDLFDEVHGVEPRRTTEMLAVAVSAIVAQKCGLEIRCTRQSNSDHLEFEFVFKDFRTKAHAPYQDFESWLERA